MYHAESITVIQDHKSIIEKILTFDLVAPLYPKVNLCLSIDWLVSMTQIILTLPYQSPLS